MKQSRRVSISTVQIKGVQLPTFGIRTKSDKTTHWQEDQGWELERKSEDHLPAAGGSAEAKQSQENSQGRDKERVGDVGRRLVQVELDFETSLVEEEHCNEHPAKNATWEKKMWSALKVHTAR